MLTIGLVARANPTATVKQEIKKPSLKVRTFIIACLLVQASSWLTARRPEGEGSSSELFRRVVEAYETLNDPARRCTYDRALQRERAPHSVSPFIPRVVEPLGNRMRAEPTASRRFASVNYRRPKEIIRWQDEVDDLFQELLRSVDIGFSFVRRSRF